MQVTSSQWRARVIVAIGLAIAAPATLIGQDPGTSQASASARRMTLAEALDQLERVNLDLALARTEVSTARARLAAAGVRPSPTVGAEHQQLTGYYETTVLASREMERGGVRRARTEGAEQALLAAEADVGAERVRLAFEVRQAYVRALAAEATLGTLDESADVFRRGERAGEAQLREGDISEFALQRLRLERARYDALIARARLDLARAGRELATLVAPDSVSAGALVLPAERLGTGALPATYGVVDALARVPQRPDVVAADAGVRAARADIDLQRALGRPTLTLSGGLHNQSDGARGLIMGASVPVGTSSRTRAAVGVAEAALENAEARAALIRRRAENEIRRAAETRGALVNRLSAVEQDLLVPAARLLSSALVAFEEGDLTLIELLDAADAYRVARETAIDLQAESLVAEYDLQRAAGATPAGTSTVTP